METIFELFDFINLLHNDFNTHDSPLEEVINIIIDQLDRDELFSIIQSIPSWTIVTMFMEGSIVECCNRHRYNDIIFKTLLELYKVEPYNYTYTEDQ
jgi:hypothetical protein